MGTDTGTEILNHVRYITLEIVCTVELNCGA